MYAIDTSGKRISRTMKSLIIFIVLNSILLIPIIGIMISEEFQWDILDYVIAGFMLNILGIVLLIIHRYIDNRKLGFSVLAITIVAFILMWVELAVGIFT